MAWKILVLIFALLLYVALIAFGLFKIGLWDKSLIKDTILLDFWGRINNYDAFRQSIKGRALF